MAVCPKCGTEVPDTNVFCTACGERTSPTESHIPPPVERSVETYGRPRDEGGYATRDPAYAYANPVNRPDSVLGTGGFVVSMILMGIPIVGFIISIVWACGGTSNLNRRNHARACLILWLIGFVISIITYIAMYDWIMVLYNSLYYYY